MHTPRVAAQTAGVRHEALLEPLPPSGADARFAIPPWLIAGAAVVASLVAGAMMAHSIKLGLAAAIALCYGPLVLINLRLAIVLWLPSVALIAVTALSVGPSLAGMLILAAWFGAFAARRSRIPELVREQAPVLAAVAVLVLWVMLSVAWAPVSPVGNELFWSWLVVVALVLVVSTTLTDPRYLRLAIGAFVVGMVIAVMVGLVGGVQSQSDAALDATRLYGGAGDPNFLAAGIVPAIALAIGLAAGSRRLSVRLAVAATVVFLTIGLVATESRGGFVAAVVAALAALVVARRERGWIIAAIVALAGVIAVWFSVDPGAATRISDLHQTNGRLDLWNVAWHMWQNNPLVGVGLEGFLHDAADYARNVTVGPITVAGFITEHQYVVHNVYLEMLAETGLVGLGLFVVAILACLRRAWRAVASFDRMGDAPMAALTRSVVVAIVAMMASNFFISGETDRRFWVVLALGPALMACATRRARVSARPGAGRSPGRG